MGVGGQKLRDWDEGHGECGQVLLSLKCNRSEWSSAAKWRGEQLRRCEGLMGGCRGSDERGQGIGTAGGGEFKGWMGLSHLTKI